LTAQISMHCHWGYRVLIVPDPDGNELYFPYPGGAGG
jgi:hypothetical protein